MTRKNDQNARPNHSLFVCYAVGMKFESFKRWLRSPWRHHESQLGLHLSSSFVTLDHSSSWKQLKAIDKSKLIGSQHSLKGALWPSSAPATPFHERVILRSALSHVYTSNHMSFAGTNDLTHRLSKGLDSICSCFWTLQLFPFWSIAYNSLPFKLQTGWRFILLRKNSLEGLMISPSLSMNEAGESWRCWKLSFLSAIAMLSLCLRGSSPFAFMGTIHIPVGCLRVNFMSTPCKLHANSMQTPCKLHANHSWILRNPNSPNTC